MLTEQKAGEILINVAPNIIHVVEYLQENGIKRLEDIQGQGPENISKLNMQLLTLMRIAVGASYPEITHDGVMQILEGAFRLTKKQSEYAKRFYADMLKNAIPR